MIIYKIFFLVIMVQFANPQQFRETDESSKANEIEWNPQRKLKWDDFMATPPPVSVTNASASTNCGFDVSAESDNNKELIAVRIKNIFYCDKSWVRTDKRNRSDLLEHEQAHFDLCEVYARRLRKRVKDSNYKLDIDNAIFEVFEAFRERQKLYDKETNHSRNKEKQVAWLKTIADELQELNAFKK
jgi:hypothetical protein